MFQNVIFDAGWFSAFPGVRKYKEQRSLITVTYPSKESVTKRCSKQSIVEQVASLSDKSISLTLERCE